MAEHTDRKTGARGVFRRVADFAKRKLQSNRLNTNPNRELRDMTEEELVIMMEAAFAAPAFSQDSDRLSFFRECLSGYEADMHEIEGKIASTSNEEEKQELKIALDSIKEIHGRLSNAIKKFEVKHRTSDQEEELNEIRTLVEQIANYHKEYLNTIIEANDLYEAKKFDDPSIGTSYVEKMNELDKKVNEAGKTLGEKVSAYVAKYSSIDPNELRKAVVSEETLRTSYEKTYRNLNKAENESQKEAFRQLLESIRVMYERYCGKTKAATAIEEIEKAVNEELKKGKDAPEPAPHTSTEDDTRTVTPPVEPAGPGTPTKTGDGKPAPTKTDEGAAPTRTGDGSTPAPAPAGPSTDAPAPAPTPTRPPIDPDAVAAPTDTTEEYKSLKEKYIATIAMINRMTQEIENINNQEESMIASKLYNDKDNITKLIQLEKRAKDLQDKVFDLKVQLSDLDYQYFMDNNKIIGLDPDVKGLAINNVSYTGSLDEFVEAHNSIIAEKYQEIVASNEAYKKATTPEEKKDLVEKVNKKLEFITYIKSMISRRLLSERQKNNAFDIIGYMKNHMVAVPDGFTRTEGRTDAPTPPAPTEPKEDEPVRTSTPGTGKKDGEPSKTDSPASVPTTQPKKPTTRTKTTAQPTPPTEEPAAKKPRTKKPSTPSVNGATIIGMKLEIRQVQKIKKEESIIIKNLYEVKSLKDTLRIIFKKELVDQLKALKAKINIEAQTKDGRIVTPTRKNAVTWDFENPDEIESTSIDIVSEDEQKMGR